VAKASALSGGVATRGRASAVEQLLVGVLLLAVAIAGAVVFLVASGLVGAEQIIRDEGLRGSLLGFAETGTLGERALAAAASALVGLGSLVLLFRRVGPERTSGVAGATHAQHILVADDEGMVMVATAGIASVAETAALRAHGVVDADVRVSGRGSAPVRIHVVAKVYRGADLRRAGKDARESIKGAIEKLVGIEVTDVNVELVVSEEVGREIA
jgi:hypothetical protein